MKAVVSRFWLSALALAVLGLAVPFAAAAQACLGSPAGPGQLTLRGEVAFPEEATAYGGTAMYRMQGPLSVFATFAVTDPELDGVNNANSVGGGLAFDLVSLVPELPQSLSLCPVAGVTYGFWDQTILGLDTEVRDLSVPLGVGIGTTIPIADMGMTLTPFVIPQFVWSRTTLKVAGESDSESETFFAGSGGVSLGVGPVIIGGTVGKRFEDGFKAVFGVHLGLVF